MVKQYLNFQVQHGIDPKTQTQNVGFTTTELMDWMQKVRGITDEFRICFGVYPAGHPNAGRVTAIVWPYKDGKPALKPTVGKGGDDTLEDPYNEGSLTP
jgi:hypothetical protein